MKIGGVVAGLLLVASAAQAKVSYDIDGEVIGSSLGLQAGQRVTGTVDIDDEAAVPDDDARAARGSGWFSVPVQFSLAAGAYSFGGVALAVQVTKAGFYCEDAALSAPGLPGNATFAFGGDLFDQDPDQNLSGARWGNLQAPVDPVELSTYGEHEAGGIFFKIAKLSQRHEQFASAGVPDYGDSSPTPEPSTFIQLGAALAALGAYRRRKSWKRG